MTFVTINEAAEMIGVCKKTLERWDKKGLTPNITRIKGRRYYSIIDLADLIGMKRRPYCWLIKANFGKNLPNLMQCTDGTQYRKRAIKEKEINLKLKRPCYHVHYQNSPVDLNGEAPRSFIALEYLAVGEQWKLNYCKYEKIND